ncbi:MAG: hypothetical protein JJT94_06465 [Bernardetiaceae bacterium]|nr:hypothetical protein [Bernardetiaceae bacterium]
MLIGIDFGAQLAGTTVIAAYANQEIRILQSIKKKSADDFIAFFLKKHNPSLVAFDAPLSLPGVYRGLEGCEDYFYRQGDKQWRAMSPMFLGGLTARAMRLRALFSAIAFIEAYPKVQAERLDFDKNIYKKEKQIPTDYIQKLESDLGCALPTIMNWHQFDAALALLTAMRFEAGQAVSVGAAEEGQMFV